MTQEYLFIDYKTWGEIMDGLVHQLKKLKKMTGVYDFNHVYAPPRGGLPIAVHLSHHLKLEMVDIDPNFIPDWFEPKYNLLVIDDIVDTGETFQNIKKLLDVIIEDMPTFQYKFASIHYKPRTILKPDIFMQEVSNDTWVVYPFENCEECQEDKQDFAKRRSLNTTQRAARIESGTAWSGMIGE